MPLPPAVRERLRIVIGAAPIVHVHEGEAADAFVRRERADAVAVGQDVYFRHGRFRPDDEGGFALLAHEAVHAAAATEPNASWLRSTARARADEEVSARAAEAAALPRSIAPVLDVNRAGPLVPERSAPPEARPLAAAVDRAPLERAPAPVIDFRALGRDVHQQLLAQIRSDFERGA